MQMQEGSMIKNTRFLAILMIAMMAASILGPAQTTVTAAQPQNADSKSILGAVSSIGILDIPATDVPIKVDGQCSDAAYGGAVSQTFSDGGGSGTVKIVHTATKLIVCMIATAGTFSQRSGAVYLDPQGDGSTYTYAEKNDFRLQVGILSGTNSSYHGTGVADGYVADTTIPGFWSGAATTDAKNDTVEYEIDLASFGLGDCGQVFGLAVYHHDFAAAGDDYGWPSNMFYDQPRTWQLVKLVNGPCSAVKKGPIAYVFRGELSSAISFYNLLSSAGYGVTLVPLSDVAATDFSAFELILVADDTGNLDTWGTPPITAAQVAKITAPNIPILGLGEGGYAFFGRLGLFIGWPQGWHGPQEKMWKVATSPPPIFVGTSTNPVNHYLSPQNSVGIYLGVPSIPLNVVPFALEDPQATNHASLIIQDCRMLWGNGGNPYQMTADGKTVFLNSVAYMSVFQCPAPPPPTNDCFTITKTANPPSGSAVMYGDVITYTLTYTFVAGAGCPLEGRLIDKIPDGTMFIPGSAGSTVPAADGTLNWVITSADSPKQKSFSVKVTQQNCVDQPTITNSATITAAGLPNLESSPTSHPVTCPPVSLPNENPPYTESEIQVHPYPMVAGRPSQVSVRLTNSSLVPQPVVVNFETSPTGFGIGLAFSPFASVPATLPPGGSAVLSAYFTPPTSGLYSIQIRVTGTNFPSTPVITQQNLDVMEDLHPGASSPFTFSVRNDSGSTTTITLVVDNSCPGWTAVVAPPTLTGMAPGEIRTATLTVTPPSGASTLGSGCHIDVQAWDGTRLIGGIRKLDVPIINLPVGVIPPWEEPEISFIPTVPVAGMTNQICVELQNPTSLARDVTVQYQVADFGAGIGFTNVAEQTFTLPAHSINRYCVNWAPAGSGTLHRCVLVTLKQPGYQDMRSQRNVDIQPAGSLPTFDVPFQVTNPDLVSHLLTFQSHLMGIDPNMWTPVIQMPGGGDPPPVINPGESIQLHLLLLPAVDPSPQAIPADSYFGSQRQVQVAVLFDGVVHNGFSVSLSYFSYMPKVSR
jgi:hypothetical protein